MLVFLWVFACGISLGIMVAPWLLKFVKKPKSYIPLPIFWAISIAGAVDMNINVRAIDNIIGLENYVNPIYSLIIGICMLSIGLVLIFLPCKLCLSIPENPTKVQLISIMTGIVFACLSVAPLSAYLT